LRFSVEKTQPNKNGALAVYQAFLPVPIRSKSLR
jgi:hypothetical protein